jgi:hypothetical protein
MQSRSALALVLVPACLIVAASASPVSGKTPAEVAREYLMQNLNRFGLIESDVSEVAISSEVASRHNGLTHVYLQQLHRGIEVHNGISNVNVDAGGAVLSAGSRFFPNIASAAGSQSAVKDALEAVAAAAGLLSLTPTGPFEVLSSEDGPAEEVTISSAGIARKPIAAKLVWVPVGASIRLAWSLEIEEIEGDHWWDVFMDAETGALLAQNDLIIHDSIDAIANILKRHGRKKDGDFRPRFPTTDGAGYRVFPLPFESPSETGRRFVTRAADPAASPFGWHDTNGIAGPEFTRTQGNNVHAYADRDNNNIADPGSDPDGGANLKFDFPLDLTVRPLDSQPAMVTNLFYWNNLMHDVTYGYGFDEASGNFQQTNYTAAGIGNDYVRAEAQDGSGRNNANFGTGVEGVRPRMQMFEWRSSTPNPIVVDPPSPIAGTYFGPMGGFGESLVTTGPISGEVVYVGRGCDPAFQAGQPLDPYLANPMGKIALIDRGSCTFVAKVRKAEVNGAILVIVANNIAGAPIAMGGADPNIVIPSVMISLDDGNLFKANVPFNVTVSDGTGGVPDRDSDLDAGVIAHEYGHGISNRLTGGPAVVNCLNNAEQMGEGWSDWFALNLTTDPDDTLTTARGIGTYVIFEPPDGLGIRPTPYTTDMTVNPSTYASVADVVNISQPHGIGYVWNTMLWETYWNLVDRHGYNANIYEPWDEGGNNLALQLVMDGMKLQPCRPGFVDGRNAILNADLALTEGENQCEIWRAFAKRGLGFGANQGDSNNRTDGVAAFDLPASCTAVNFGGFSSPVDDPPDVNRERAGRTIPVKFKLTGAVESFSVDSQRVDCTTLEPTGDEPREIASYPDDDPDHKHGHSCRHWNRGRHHDRDTDIKRKGDFFFFDWRTSDSWDHSCRRLTIRIPAPSDGVAYFKFK